MQEVRTIALSNNLEPGPSKSGVIHMACDFGPGGCATRTLQTELIRTIQARRGDEPCFSTGKRYDCAEICEWRRNCRKTGVVWLR